MKKTVGIIGAGGVIGKELRKILRKKNIPYICCSRKHTPGEYAGEKWIYADANKEKSIKNIECDILVNCSGPSLITSPKIRSAIREKKMDYVDAFGWTKNEENSKGEGRWIINSGCVPGLSGALINYMCSSDTSEIKIWSGGKEEGSYGALGDIIISSVNGYSTGGCYAKSGDKVREYVDTGKQLKEAGLPDNAYVQAVVTDEISDISRRNDVEIHNYNIWSDEGLTSAMMKGCMKVAGCDDEEQIKSVISQVYEDITGYNGGYITDENRQDAWYMMEIKATGEEGVRGVRIETKDSAKITASMLAYSIEKLAKGNMPSGIYQPCDFAKGEELVEMLEAVGAKVNEYGEI